MTDDELRDTLHRIELRLERLDTKVDNLEKHLSALESRMDARFEGLETRLNTKAAPASSKPGLWGGSLAVVMALLVWLTRR